MASYYPPPPTHYSYYEPPPPPPPGASLPQTHPHPPPPQPLHHQHYLPDQPQYLSYAPSLYPHSSHDSVRTLFIAGLPEDVMAREIYNLFREFPGYESSHLRTTASTQPFAFAVFMDQQSAIMALHALNFIVDVSAKYSGSVHLRIDAGMLYPSYRGMVFDLEKGSTLFIELAKSNPRSKRLKADDEKHVPEKRSKSASFSRGLDSGVGSIHMPGMGISTSSTSGYPSTHSPGSSEATGLSGTGRKSNAPPCPTLFVASLGPSCTEEELKQVFSSCRGFLKLKMQGTYGSPVAFVDFQDTASSTEALTNLQGTVLYSSVSGEGMRLEYAKSRMGMRSKKSR